MNEIEVDQRIAASLRMVATDLDTGDRDVARAMDAEADRLVAPPAPVTPAMCEDCRHCPLPYDPGGRCPVASGRVFGAHGGQACGDSCHVSCRFEPRDTPAPDTPGGVVFVEDEEGNFVDRLGDMIEVLTKTDYPETEHYRRVDLTPAQVAAVLAMREGK